MSKAQLRGPYDAEHSEFDGRMPQIGHIWSPNGGTDTGNRFNVRHSDSERQ
jgi:hypothetical protein